MICKYLLTFYWLSFTLSIVSFDSQIFKFWWCTIYHFFCCCLCFWCYYIKESRPYLMSWGFSLIFILRFYNFRHFIFLDALLNRIFKKFFKFNSEGSGRWLSIPYMWTTHSDFLINVKRGKGHLYSGETWQIQARGQGKHQA